MTTQLELRHMGPQEESEGALRSFGLDVGQIDIRGHTSPRLLGGFNWKHKDSRERETFAPFLDLRPSNSSPTVPLTPGAQISRTRLLDCPYGSPWMVRGGYREASRLFPSTV